MEKNIDIEKRITDPAFFSIDAELLAIKLLGKTIVRVIDGKEYRFTINETECYVGIEDTACHAHIGKTTRTKVLWAQGGTLYVHLIYGLHYMLNIVAGKENEPMGVLIRGVSGVKGPGLATKIMKIDRSFNEENIITSPRIWLEDNVDLVRFARKKRVGIDYAKQCDRDKLYRFIHYD